MPRQLHESTRLAEAATTGSSGRMTIQVITPGRGSSGYYSAAVLESAAQKKLVTKGTPMYLDHPTESDKLDRPERSVRDMAAVFTEDASWDGSALVAEAQVFSPYREILTEMAPHIGVSIRASGEVSEGEVDGQPTPIVESLDEIQSVDFVTKAGRGGRVLEVLESARPSLVNERAVNRGITEATADERRTQLADAVRSAYGSDDTYAWVRDFDDTHVWFEASAEDERSRTWQQTYTVDDGDLSVTLTGTRTEVRPVTQYVPVSPAGSTTEESQEDTMPQIEEARLRQLEEAAGRVQTAEADRDAAIREVAQHRARDAAVGRARTRLAEANQQLAAATVDRIVTEATREVPLTDAGQLDETRFDATVDEARTREEAYLASLAETAGAGTVRGFGGSTGSAAGTGDRKITDQAIAEAWGRKPKES